MTPPESERRRFAALWLACGAEVGSTLELDAELRQEIEARFLNWKAMWEADQRLALVAAPPA